MNIIYDAVVSKVVVSVDAARHSVHVREQAEFMRRQVGVGVGAAADNLHSGLYTVTPLRDLL